MNKVRIFLPRFLFGLSLVFTCFIYLYCHAEYIVQVQTQGELEKQIASAQHKNEELKKEIKNKFDFKKIEERAEELGMVKVTHENSAYITVVKDDKIVITAPKSEKRFDIDFFKNFFSSLSFKKKNNLQNPIE